MFRSLLIAFGCGVCILVSAALATVLPDLRRVSPGKPATTRGGTGAPLERFDLIESIRSARLPRVGDLATDFEAKDEIGARFRLSSHLDRPLLFGSFCTCATCKKTAEAWTALLKGNEARFTAAALIALPRGEQLFDLHDELRLSFPLIPDPEHSLAAQYPGPGSGYAALGCPRAWVIGRDGRYRYVMRMGGDPTPDVMRSIARALGLPGDLAERKQDAG